MFVAFSEKLNFNIMKTYFKKKNQLPIFVLVHVMFSKKFVYIFDIEGSLQKIE